MLKYLFTYRLNHFMRSVRSAGVGQLITAGLFLMILFLVALGVYAFLYYGFGSVLGYEYLTVALPLFIYEIFLLVVSILVFASGTITGLYSLYRGKADFWILGSPSYPFLLSQKFLQVAGMSLWPLFLIALPALFAMAAVFGIGVLGFLIGFLAVVLLGFQMVALSMLLILCASFVTRLIGKVTKNLGGFTTLLSLSVIIFLILMTLLVPHFSGVDVGELFAIEDLSIAKAKTDAVTAQFAGTPSGLTAEVFSAVQTSEVGTMATLLGRLLLTTALSVIAVLLFSRPFLSLWQYFQAGAFQARAKKKERSGGRKALSGQFAGGGVTRAVLTKEWTAMFRDGRNVLWLGFLTFLWLCVTALDFFMQRSFKDIDLGTLSAPELAQVLQLLVVVYFVAALVLRFVFPSFSSERDTAWVLFTSPARKKSIFYAKALFSVFSIVLLTLVIGLIHISILEGSLQSALLFLCFTLGEALVLAVSGLAFGVIFPNFETTDPQVLSTTLSGLGFTFGALVYGALGSLAFFLTISAGFWWASVLFAILSGALAFGLTRFALHRLPKLEFTTALES